MIKSKNLLAFFFELLYINCVEKFHSGCRFSVSYERLGIWG